MEVQDKAKRRIMGGKKFLSLLLTLTFVLALFGNAAYYGVSYAATSSTNTTPQPSCESTGGVFDFAFCGLYDAFKGITDFVLKDIIIPELDTTPICTSPTGQGCVTATVKAPGQTSGNAQSQSVQDPTYAIWSSFRVYGDVILLIALLVVIISEAAGGGLLDAYSVRKALPRLLAAAILINLSIYIVAGLVDISNILGNSIFKVIVSPLQGAGAFKVGPHGEIVPGLILAGGIAAIVSAVAFRSLFKTSGGSMLIDFVLVPVLLVFLAVLFTLVIRKTIILALVIFAPVAFALYVLPNTEKWFKKWWSMLLEMLMVFPIIVIMFALSAVMTVLVSTPTANCVGQTCTTPDGQTAINSLLTLVFMILPLVLVPFSFKFAGSTIGQLHGAIMGGRSKLHAMHSGRRKRTMEGFKTNVAGQSAKNYSTLANTAVGGALLKAPVVGSRLERRVTRKLSTAELAAQQVGQSAHAKTMEHDDEALNATLGGANTNERVQAAYDYISGQAIKSGKTTKEALANDKNLQLEFLNKAKAAENRARAKIGAGQAQALWAAERLAVTGTGITDLEHEARVVNRASMGNEELRGAVAGKLNSISKQVGRHDLAPGVGKLAGLAEAQSKSGLSDAHAQEYTAKLQDAKESAWNSATLYQHGTNKTADIENSMEFFEQFKNAPNTDLAGQQKFAVYLKELRTLSSNPGTSGEVRNKIDTFLSKPDVQAAEQRITEHLRSVDPQGNPVQTTPTERGTLLVADRHGNVREERPLQSQRPITAYDAVNQRARAYNPLTEDQRRANLLNPEENQGMPDQNQNQQH